MLFEERKLSDGFQYTVDNYFGNVSFTSPAKLPSDLLDKITDAIVKRRTESGVLPVELASGEQIEVAFTFKRRPRQSWDTEEEESQ